jgi:hypothetical protein
MWKSAKTRVIIAWVYGFAFPPYTLEIHARRSLPI